MVKKRKKIFFNVRNGLGLDKGVIGIKNSFISHLHLAFPALSILFHVLLKFGKLSHLHYINC